MTGAAVTGKPTALRSRFTVVVDTREQAPYAFRGLQADAKDGSRELEIPLEFRALEAGDYSVLGFTDCIAVERKSLEDLYSTLGQGRERFEREHQRLAEYRHAAVVIEASWETILSHPPERSRLLPKTVLRTALSWSQKYGVHWHAFENRRLAEVATYRILEQFHKHETERKR